MIERLTIHGVKGSSFDLNHARRCNILSSLNFLRDIKKV
jgi:hypothetical protein